MPTQVTKAPAAVTFERAYPGRADQAARVRADLAEFTGDCPVADELVLLVSELVANAVLHSRSGYPGGMFTVHVTLYDGDYAWAEVTDQGGAWVAGAGDDEHGRGLRIVASVTGDGNWGIEGGKHSRIAWFRLHWPRS